MLKCELKKILIPPPSGATSDKHLGVNWGFLSTVTKCIDPLLSNCYYSFDLTGFYYYCLQSKNKDHGIMVCLTSAEHCCSGHYIT